MENDTAFKIGTSYFIRTVSMYYTGKLVQITPEELVLENAAWIADTGRFFNALDTGDFAEVEPYPLPVIVSRRAIVDATQWTHPLPTKQQ